MALVVTSFRLRSPSRIRQCDNYGGARGALTRFRRKHTKALLGAIAGAGKAVSNIALMSILGLRESNLSRVTGALQGTGLIERSSSGKEASFALTDLGRRVAKKLDIAVNDPGAHREWWHDAP